MSAARSMMFNAYSGGIAALTAVAAHKLVDGVWTAVTGEEPPQPNDPLVPTGKALAWVLANAIGMGVLGVLANRFAAERWMKFAGEDEVRPLRQVNFKL